MDITSPYYSLRHLVSSVESLPFVGDKLASISVRFVLPRDGPGFSVSRNRRASDLDYSAVAFISRFNGVLINPLYRDHRLAKITADRSFRAVQLRCIALSH